MTPATATLCSHCLLPLGLRSMQRMVNGESRDFCCYGCCIAYQVKNGSREEWDAAWLLIRLGVGGFLSMNIMLFSLLLYAGAFAGSDARLIPWIQFLLWIFATPVLLILGGPFLRETWANAARARLTSSALIVLGAGSAYGYSVLSLLERGAHVYFDTATMVLLLFTLGRYLEAAGRARAARDLGPLLAAEREETTVVEGSTERRCLAREVGAGILVRVRPGERIPVDGVVVEGESHADEAMITGESRQVAKVTGATAIAGSINLDGALLIRACGTGSATRWAQICRSVRDALSNRSPIQRLADHVVSAFIPFVLVLAGATVVYRAKGQPFDWALLAGLAVLLVACPCAVGLAAPLATSMGIGRLARRGCLVRSPGALEALARTRLLAFDKTGTLTRGQPRLVAVEVATVEVDEVLRRAAGLELHSEHRLARGVTEAAAARNVRPVAARDVRTVPGRGIRGNVEAQAVAAGTGVFMAELGWRLAPDLAQRARSLEASGHSIVYVGWGEQVQAVLALDDTPLPEAQGMIEALRRLGLRVALLTGDHAEVARRVAVAIGVGDWQARLSPEAKRAALHQRRCGRELVAMVGDGLNDGLVLASADVGIAVGSATDLARETADLVLPAGGLWMLPWVIGLARAMRRTIFTNLMWAFGYNLIALTLAVLGLLQPILAAGVMAGSSLLVVLNSLRLERFPDPIAAGASVLPERQPAGLREGDSSGRQAGIPTMKDQAIQDA